MTVERTNLAPGYDISRIIKGGWHLAGDHGAIDREQALHDMAAFVEAGITTFDCADIYTGVEEMIGDFRRTYPSLARGVQIHTKFVPDLPDLPRVDRAYVERIAELVREKRIEGVGDLRDESDRQGLRVVIELKRDASAEVVLNQLYRFTPLQTSFGVNMLALNHGRPEQMGLKPLIDCFVAFREEVVVRRTKFELNKARDRGHVLVGLAIAVVNIDEVIAIIRSSKDPAEARERLTGRDWPAGDMIALIDLIADPRTVVIGGDRVRLTDEQARAILALTLSRLTGLGREEIMNEARELAAAIQGYLDILGSRERVMAIVREELVAVREAFAVPRRSVIVEGDADVEDEDLIAREDMVITVTHGGYVKRTPLANLSDPAPRRQGPLRHVDQGRGCGDPRLLRLDPRAGAVLLVGRQGLQTQGLAPAGWLAQFARQGLHQPAADRAGRKHHLDPAPARGRKHLGPAGRDVRHPLGQCAAQQAVRLRSGQSQRQDRHEAGRGRFDHRRRSVHRGQ